MTGPSWPGPTWLRPTWPKADLTHIQMRSALNPSVVWELTTEGERLFYLSIFQYVLTPKGDLRRVFRNTKCWGG